MRLSGIMSKEPSNSYCTVDGFLDKNLKTGKYKKIDVGRITLPFYCKECDDVYTFFSEDEKMVCIGVNEYTVSISTVLKCQNCNSIVPVWFLIESDNDFIATQLPKVRILKRSFKLYDAVSISNERYGDYSEFIYKANQAYNEGLGAGAIVYLRKIYEQLVIEMAIASNIDINTNKGKRKKFGDLLKEVDAKCSIVPREFSKDKYKLFAELSNVIHGTFDEKLALKQFPAFYRLVIGILDNIKNNKEINEAIKNLNWNEIGGKEIV